jgi:ribosomal protein S18 acetylase RimI-like enzyme
MTDPGLMPIPLGPADAGEVLTLQRAAYVTEAQSHDDLQLPPLTQGLADLQEELGCSSVQAWGIRNGDGRLVAAVRVAVIDGSAQVNRLVVAPDQQGRGLGSALLAHAEGQLGGDVATVELFTGEYSTANLRLYRRVGYQETHRTSAGTYDLVHMSKVRAVVTEAEHGQGSKKWTRS